MTRPEDVIEHGVDSFSFSAFNRDYLARHEGFSMVVLGSKDAVADRLAWQESGFPTYLPLEFSRMAELPDGTETRVGFVLALTHSPAAPWLGHFVCQHFTPDYYEQPQYLDHANTALSVREVWVAGPGALDLVGHFATFTGLTGRKSRETVHFDTDTGTITLATDLAFQNAFGVVPPHPHGGAHLAGLSIACASLEPLRKCGLVEVGDRLVLPPERAFGTAIAFTA
ncbi:hypothetical protein OU426_15875 [Frigidibacter sp. RF13]|uniref:hypothetical protein n=1 Tax=Frigidibacter sp. RF13 TaxID=2997340 RepID=UPI00226FB314|nr:hypothetical protein [Frigidibacter sp. RF13]MCY1128343.1 hypothetical protein [Frigidibacter sp. RF13]